MMINLSSTV